MSKKAAHTPGPWRMQHRGANRGYDIMTDIPGYDVTIALVDGLRGESLEANAKLIATAPDMLLALEEVSKSIPRNGTLGRYVKSVINKVQGEQ